MKHVHLIGIGGTGLSAIARVLLERGVQVSGSDRAFSPLAQALQSSGAQVFVGHQAGQIDGADLVVRSSAIPDDNIEVQAARQSGIPVYKRVEFLPQLLAGKQVLAVAGTHGKTTTTAMLAWVLQSAGRDAGYIIGSLAENLGANAHAGQAAEFVIEADEYDYMFLGLHPWLAVITNIEHDHPDCFPSAADYLEAFARFIAQVRQDGHVLVCSDDRAAWGLAARAGRACITYGLERHLSRRTPEYYGVDLRPGVQGGYHFRAVHRAETLAEIDLRVPGRHNVRNALAALAAADQLGIPAAEAAIALGEFRGTDRRFTLRGEAGGVLVIDDYAHHPTEVRATLEAARARYPGRRIWAVWQPHTFSRTRSLQADFAEAFTAADRVLVLAIYAAREAAPEDGFDGARVAGIINHSACGYAADFGSAEDYLQSRLAPGDVVLVLSAGDAQQLSERLLALRNQVESVHTGTEE